VLIRHGQPEGVAPKSFLGHSDPALSDEGWAQAQAAGRILQARVPSATRLVASDLIRARQTAEGVARVVDLPISVEPALREIDFGDWDGKTFEAVGPTAFAWFDDPDGGAPPGGESLRAVAERVDAWVDERCRAPVDGPEVVVAHFGSLAVLAARLLGLKPVEGLRLTLQRGEVGCISGGGLRWWGLP
jgi:broad specificity phosphatase PhoE